MSSLLSLSQLIRLHSQKYSVSFIIIIFFLSLTLTIQALCLYIICISSLDVV